MDLKMIIKHLANGTLGEHLCIICLAPLSDKYENIFTKICKEGDFEEFCVADVLETICHLTFSEHDNYNACVDCFTTAYQAQKFFILSQSSNEILNFYTDHITQNLDEVHLPEEVSNNSLCISLPAVLTVAPSFDLNMKGIGKYNVKGDALPKIKTEKITKTTNKEDDDNIVVVVQENGEPLFYKVQTDGTLVLLDENEKKNYRKTLSKSISLPKSEEPKVRKKREPMAYKLCSRCPVKYRFAAKLKEHMKLNHNIDLFICKICKAITEEELEYHTHMKTHTNVHQCAICHTIFKKRDTIIKHLKWHEKMKNMGQTEGAHICEICGVITEDADSLREHYENKHYKKYTCYYCGRLYRREVSFELHIKKHEARMQNTEKRPMKDAEIKEDPSPAIKKDASVKQKCMCPTCGRYFVNERALMWHQRLHNNERPYECEICGRAFVSLNRRNQHSLCAHTAPTRRCPLCPALFHLRSMVNTHIKKVHLKAHKRRNRVSKHQNVFWRTEPVPIQDLSVDIQNDILELQAKKFQIPNSAQMIDIDDL